MVKEHTPFFWSLFSIGGTLCALLFPIHIFLLGLAFPLGLFTAPKYEFLLEMLKHPVTRLYLFIFISFPLFHWAHRFRYTLYDGLQLYHLCRFIAIICYGAALLGTVAAAYLLLTVS